jgi:hypothetical protein
MPGTPNKTLTRSTRARLILFGTPCLRAFTDVCGFAMASLCTLQSRPEFIGFVDRDFDAFLSAAAPDVDGRTAWLGM